MEAEKAAKCQARVAFWPLFDRKNRILLWSGADCKFAGFTPSVVRIHSYPKPLPEPFFKWLILIRPSLAGFDSTADRKVRSSRARSAQIQLVEIARALSYDAQIVIMEQGQSISELEALDPGFSPAGGTGQ